MAAWSEFAAAAPELAALGLDRFERTGLALVGTIRKDGSPRISPVEPFLIDGQLYLGMMWQSKKALDLGRDPRCVVHSVVSDKAGTEGDFKLYGRAIAVTNPTERERYCQVLQAKIGWRPQGDFHLFAVDVTQVGFVRFGGGEQLTQRWRVGEPVTPAVRAPSPT
jgi:hypothetical protein